MEKSLSPNITEDSKEVLISLLKVKFALLGPIGTVLDEFIFNHGERIRIKRMESLLNCLMEELSQVKNDNFDINSLENNDEFYDLTISIFKSALETSSIEKHELLSRIFIENVLSEEQLKDDYSSIMVRYVNELTPSHILVFRYLITNLDEFKEVDSYQTLFNSFIEINPNSNIDKYLFRLLVKDLENKTLLRVSPDVHEYGTSGGYLALENHQEISRITLTSIGEKFAGMLGWNK